MSGGRYEIGAGQLVFRVEVAQETVGQKRLVVAEHQVAAQVNALCLGRWWLFVFVVTGRGVALKHFLVVAQLGAACMLEVGPECFELVAQKLTFGLVGVEIGGVRGTFALITEQKGEQLELV